MLACVNANRFNIDVAAIRDHIAELNRMFFEVAVSLATPALMVPSTVVFPPVFDDLPPPSATEPQALSSNVYFIDLSDTPIVPMDKKPDTTIMKSCAPSASRRIVFDSVVVPHLPSCMKEKSVAPSIVYEMMVCFIFYLLFLRF